MHHAIDFGSYPLPPLLPMKKPFVMLMVLTALLCGVVFPSVASMPVITATKILERQGTTAVTQPPEQQGREWYQAGRYQDAIAAFEHALQDYQSQGDTLRQAMTLSNLALCNLKVGNGEKATEAIAQSLALLHRETLDSHSSDYQSVLAQTLNIQGYVQLEQGQSEAALATWAQTTPLYEQLHNPTGVIQSQINQAQAMQALGLYRRAIALLSPLQETLKNQPDTVATAVGLRSLGEALQVAGDLNQS